MDVRGAVVVVDNLTNDIRGTRQRPAAALDELVSRTDRLRRIILEAGAATVILCQVKPMQHIDVTPHNASLHSYLRANGSYGVPTQIRLGSLKDDGYHVRDRYVSVIYKTYACAIMGIHVPCPTPWDEFVPDQIRRQRDREYPELPRRGNVWDGLSSEGQHRVHGWSWK